MRGSDLVLSTRGCGGGPLGTLSGISFPKLVSLTIVHDAVCDLQTLRTDFRLPETPSLRHLRIHSPIFWRNHRAQPGPLVLHPLLKNVQRKDSSLNYLVLSHGSLLRYCSVMMQELLGMGKNSLPGQLRSIILQPGSRIQYIPEHYHRTAEYFLGFVRRRNVEGLTAQLPR